MNDGHNNTFGEFRILSIDGGGVRGLLAAKILAGVEELLNRKNDDNIPLGRRFDLLAGTSTGGIIALALATGRPVGEIVEFYEKYIPKIFGKKNSRGMPGLLLHPKYSSQVLEEGLTEFFGDATLANVSTDVCIPAVALQNAKPRLYKSNYLGRNMRRLDEKLVDIALCTSAAPTYFSAHSSKHSSHLIDGGVVANNPAMIAVVEALQFERESKRGRPSLTNDGVSPFANITMLSVGTGDQCAMPYNMHKLTEGGAINWAIGKENGASLLTPIPVFPLLEIMMHSQSQLAHFQVKHILEQRNYLRINPQLKLAFKLDDAERIDELKNLSDISADVEEYVCEKFS